jgi:hypothetical protein
VTSHYNDASESFHDLPHPVIFLVYYASSDHPCKCLRSNWQTCNLRSCPLPMSAFAVKAALLDTLAPGTT